MTLSGVPNLDAYTLIRMPSPGFNEFFVIPEAMIVPIDASSPRHLTTLPVWSFVSQTTVTWGLLQRYSTTVASIVVSVVVYCEALWCADTILPAITNTAARARIAIVNCCRDLI